ncbi:MAG: YceI family protein [Flavobacteriaceae bacterium]|nr:YceI family protein [Flavobacteriaceae bacterium]
MKNLILNFALVAFISLGAGACKEKEEKDETATATDTMETAGVSADFNVNVDESTILWKGSKPLGSHNGTIALASGTVMVKDGAPAGGKFSIDMNTITDLDLEGQMKDNLEAHLKGTVEGKEGDFFNVTEYPFASFEMTGVTEADGTTMVNGNLTIKDKTNPVSFPAAISVEENMMTLKSEPFTIDRTKWGVNFGSKSIFDNLGDKFIDDEIELTISVVANKS